jgi:hypothetical protein
MGIRTFNEVIEMMDATFTVIADVYLYTSQLGNGHVMEIEGLSVHNISKGLPGDEVTDPGVLQQIYDRVMRLANETSVDDFFPCEREEIEER